MKVLVIGDSYGLPRYAKNSFNVELDYAGTYPEQLKFYRGCMSGKSLPPC